MTTYVVDPSGKGTHLTVQAALDAAASGEAVSLWITGVYGDTVNIQAHVTLLSDDTYRSRYMRIKGISGGVVHRPHRRTSRYIDKG